MSNEVCQFALKSTLQEIQNIYPDIVNSFIFKDGKILAQDSNTKEETANQTMESFSKINERAAIIGGLEALTIQGASSKVSITTIKDFHLTTVSSKKAEEKYVNALTRVLIPIVIKISEMLQSDTKENEISRRDDKDIKPSDPERMENEAEEEISEVHKPQEAELLQPEAQNEDGEKHKLHEENESVEEEINDEPLLPEPPVMQLMVENLRGFRVPSDTVRVDQEVIKQWDELYSDKKINEVEIEALNGRTSRCKFKKIKKSKDAGKGIIKMPEKIQISLEIAAGELVTVKPVVT